jgi:hypothetical protein
VTNWSDYDAALRQRGSLTVWFTDEAVAAWRAEPRTTRGGQPHYSALAILTALTLRAVFRLAQRQTEGLIGSILRLLGLDLAVPDHSTLSRRAETLDVPRPRPGGEPIHLLVDSTGLKLCGAGEWLVERHGTRRRRSWRKLHLGVDAETGQIVAAALTPNDVDDGSQVGRLLDQVTDPVASFTGDGGQNLYGAFGVKRFSLSSAQSSILFKFLCSVGEPFLCPGLHPGSEPRGAAVNIAVGTAGGGAKRC